jgi:hypothetical protein
MRKKALTILGALLIVGTTVQIAAATKPHKHKAERALVPASQQFRDANNALAGPSAAAEQYWSDREEGHVISAPAGR